MTTRLCPRVLEAHGDLLQGCRKEELTQLQPADAVAFFRSQGIRGSRAEIEAACQPYGYHPLSLRLLAGLVSNDLRQPGDIKAVRRLDLTGDLIQRRHHVLEQAYDNLTPARQQLLSRIACFRGPVDYDALHALAQEEADREFGANLRNLVSRGLLHHDRATNRYDLHPIVRRYAYDRLTDKTAAHAQLRDYFAAVPEPEKIQRLEDLAPVIELYHHTVRAGQYDKARDLLEDRLVPSPLHYQFGAYQLNIELLRALFPNGEDRPPSLTKEHDQAWTLAALASSYGLSGQPRRAVPLFEQHNAIYQKLDNKNNLAAGLVNLANQHLDLGSLRAAEANLRRETDLCRKIEAEFHEASGHLELGLLLAYRGAFDDAEQHLTKAQQVFDKFGPEKTNFVSVVRAYGALSALLMGDVGTALQASHRALELADETARTSYPVERDYVRAHWLLGAAHRANGDLDRADRHLTEALTRCRGINMVDYEADILLDLARLRAAQGAQAEALQLAREALLITERSGYVLQGADVNLFLAELALKDGDKEQALHHARQSRQLATCDGPPDYTYKVAYEEAGSLLEQLGAAG